MERLCPHTQAVLRKINSGKLFPSSARSPGRRSDLTTLAMGTVVQQPVMPSSAPPQPGTPPTSFPLPTYPAPASHPRHTSPCALTLPGTPAARRPPGSLCHAPHTHCVVSPPHHPVTRKPHGWLLLHRPPRIPPQSPPYAYSSLIPLIEHLCLLRDHELPLLFSPKPFFSVVSQVRLIPD